LLLENRRRRIAERKALEQEAHFRVLIEQAPDAILVYDIDLNRFVDANINAERLFACSREELLQSGPLRFYPETKLKGYEYNEVISRVLNNESISLEGKVKNAEGLELVCELRLARLPSKDHKLIRVSYDDITERKQAEEALIQSEQKVRAIFDHSYGFIGLLAADGTMLECNRTALEFSGISIEDVRGTPFCGTPWWAHSPEDQERLHAAVLTAAKGKMVRYEAKHAAPDGTIHFVDFSLKPVLDESGEVILLIPEGRDITDYKNLKDQLYQSQKMDSLGRLAGGVAHDFNNMLSIIIGSAELLLRKVAEGDQLHRYIEQIFNAAKRSSEITQQLLAFSRNEIIFPRPINLNSLIIESIKILDRLISEDIRLAFHPSNDLWIIKIDPSQLDQILMNLLVNARDAMPNGGSLSIGTANLHIDGDYSSNHYNVKPGDYVQLTVSDTGSGMDQETQKRIFEPFFTTKEVGKGTGLGLATVFGIVTQNNGFIKVYSEIGQGTVFKMYFPRLAEEAFAAEEPIPMPMTGSGTILLVEDEEMLLDTTTYMLEEIGYTVIQAQSPEAAIAICEKKNQQIDLILTDVVMPGLNGREMVDRIKSIFPKIKVLFMSGYTADIIAQRGIVDEGMHFISKPIDMNKLNEKLKEILSHL
jgi:PAS domain S-box-containing protein